MDSDSIALIIAIVILMFFSSFFSASETAFITFNKIKMKNLANTGNKTAKAVLELNENYDKLLTTVLIGNNIVNITMASVSTVLFIKYFQGNGATISTVFITILVLIFGEITPKTLSKNHSDAFCLASCGILKFFCLIFSPLSFIFTKWQDLLAVIVKSSNNTAITDEELITIVDEAKEEGGLDSGESELIKSAIEFNDVTASEILTPRVDIVAVPIDSIPDEITSTFHKSGFSRIPVYDDSIDNVIGILHEKDFYSMILSGKNDIKSVLSKPVFVSKHIKISGLLKIFQSSKCHIALVSDEFGGLLGIVTMEDIIEELIGDVWDEHDEVENLISAEGSDSFIIDCALELDEFAEIFDIKFEDDENDLPQTVNGWLIMKFGNFPEPGETLDLNNIHIEILKVDATKISKIKVKKQPLISNSENSCP